VRARLTAVLVRPRSGLAILLVVLAAALVVGSGVGRSAAASPAARAAALETQIRCPSCEDVSVADSSAPTALTVRHEIQQWTAAGESNQQIENTLVDRYGIGILLSPPGRGLLGVVWLVPVVVGVVGLGYMAVFFWRRSRDLRRLRAGSGAVP